MGHRKIGINGLFLIYAVLVGIIAVASLGGLWAYSELSQFKEDTEATRTAYLEDQKALLKREVERALGFVDHMRSQTERRLSASVREKTYEAYAVARGIYEAEREKRPPEEIIASIREALRRIRYNDGRGYFFAFDLKGIEVLFPISPEMEGRSMMAILGGKDERVVPDMLALVQKEGEGFYNYYWLKPDKKGVFPKIAYVKLFEPLNLVIGTGEYLDDVEQDIQAECLTWISNIKFGRDGYVFAGQWDGLSLSGPQAGKNMLEAEDINGIKIVRELIQAARSGGGFVHYVMPKFDGQKHAPKLSYAAAVPQWEWYIGSGMYVDDIEAAIARKQSHQKEQIKSHIRNTMLMLLAVSLFIFLLARFFSKRLRAGLDEFNRFFKKAASHAAVIDKNAFYFSEFAEMAGAANQMVENRKQAETALTESEEKYRSLFQASGEGILLIRDTIFDCNRAALTILGYEKAELLGKTLTDLAPPVLADGRNPIDVQQAVMQAAYAGESQTFEWECRRKDGSIAELDFTLSAVTIADGQFLLASGRDITDIRQAQRGISESEMRLKTIVENSPYAFYAYNHAGILTQVNEAACHQLGYPREELIGTFVTDIETTIPPSTARNLWDAIQPGMVHLMEGVQRRKDGTLFPVETRLTALTFRGEKFLFVFAGDITERKEMERAKASYQSRMIQAQKMEAIGTLAGGIAHNFNNLLMGIQGRASLMALGLPPEDPLTEHIQAIINCTKSAAHLTGQLLGIARGGKYEAHPTDINEALRESVAMFGRTRKEIRMHTALCDPSPVAVVDRNQLAQVFLNLFINAWQAMPEGGDIRVETSILALDGEFCKPHGVSPGRYVKIRVSDTGVGIDESIRHRIFDPFFTTKETGRGTGLGLSSAYGIVKNHAGIITASSHVGEGTSFDIYLPFSEGQILPTASPEEDPPAPGTETILLVDDEPVITQVGKVVLERLGYRVLCAGSGREAIDILGKAGSEIRLVILDMIMPEMNGGETFDAIRKLHPALPILLSSGYALDAEAEKIMARGCNGFIQKPFGVAALSRKIRSILDPLPEGSETSGGAV